jgi:MFS family permease
MSGSLLDRLLRGAFGEEGTVAKEAELQVVMAATALGVAGTFVVSPIVSDLTGPLAVSEAQAGQLITAFIAPSILLVPAMGMLADRVGRKPTLVAGLVVFGLGGGAIALVTDYAVVLALRVVQGVGYAAIIPVGVTMLGDLYEASREATAQGFRIVGIQAVGLLSPPLAGLLVVASWRSPFLLYFLALVVAGWAWLALPAVQPGGGEPLRRYVTDLVASIRRPVIAAVMLLLAVRFVLTTGFITYVSVLLARQVGASAFTAGLVVSAFSLVSLVGSAQAGRVTAAWNSLLVLAAGFLVGGAGMAVMGLTASLPVILGGMVLLGMGGGVTAPVQKSLVTQLVDPSFRGGAVSAALVLQSVGQTAAPQRMGLLLQRYAVGPTFVAFGVTGGLLGTLLAAGAYVANAEVGTIGGPATGD